METSKSCYSADLGKLLLRLTLAGLLLFHGVHKITTGVDWMVPMLKDRNWPDFIRYGVYIGEVLAPAMILVGFWTRIAALVVAINMVVAVILAHSNDLLKLNEMSGGWQLELDGWYFFSALAVALLGPGCFSIDQCLWKRCKTDKPADLTSTPSPSPGPPKK